MNGEWALLSGATLNILQLFHLVFRDAEVQHLQDRATFRSLPHMTVQPIQIVLACSAGETKAALAKGMGLTGMTAGRRRKRCGSLDSKARPTCSDLIAQCHMAMLTLPYGTAGHSGKRLSQS